MVIIGKRAGQMGNRLFLFAHIIANAIEYNYEVRNPSFYSYSRYFIGTRDDFFCGFPAKKTRLLNTALQGLYYTFFNKCVLPLSRFSWITRFLNVSVLDITNKNYSDESYDMTNREYIQLATSNKPLIIKDAWLFRDFTNISKHADQIRAFFTPVQQHADAVSDLVSRARKDGELLIGIHIRQGDYKRWQGGAYFFTTAEYAAIMRRVAAAMPEKRIKFLVCSNVKQDEGVFQGLNYILGNNHPLEDMYAFAQCDFLIGPPSTYTAWASFYGSVPLSTINNIDVAFTPDDFHIAQG